MIVTVPSASQRPILEVNSASMIIFGGTYRFEVAADAFNNLINADPRTFALQIDYDCREGLAAQYRSMHAGGFDNKQGGGQAQKKHDYTVEADGLDESSQSDPSNESEEAESQGRRAFLSLRPCFRVSSLSPTWRAASAIDANLYSLLPAE